MIYRILADLILILHFCFVLFAVFGGLLVLRWRWMWKLHIPAVVWGFFVQYFVWICPLTDWENYFRQLSGEFGYKSGFIEYYIVTLLYPEVTPQIHFLLAVSLLICNLLMYYFVFRQMRHLS